MSKREFLVGVGPTVSRENKVNINTEEYWRGYQDGLLDAAIQFAALANDIAVTHELMPCQFDLSLIEDKEKAA
jgi:hypothetical protein